MKTAAEAIDRPATIETQSPQIARRLWGIRSLALARRGKIREAGKSRPRRCEDWRPGDADALGVVARTYALCLKSESSLSGVGVSAVEGKPSLHAQKALDALRTAERLQRGYTRGECLEPDFERTACVSGVSSIAGRRRW